MVRILLHSVFRFHLPHTCLCNHFLQFKKNLSAFALKNHCLAVIPYDISFFGFFNASALPFPFLLFLSLHVYDDGLYPVCAYHLTDVLFRTYSCFLHVSPAGTPSL